METNINFPIENVYDLWYYSHIIRQRLSKLFKVNLIMFLVLMNLCAIPYYLSANSKIYPGSGRVTFSKFIETCDNFDTVFIHNQVFQENNIKIEKPLTIIGINYPVFDAQYKSGDIFLIKSDNVTIKGCEFRNVKMETINDNAAIKLKGVRHCTIENNRVINGFFAIYLANTSFSVVKNNYIKGNGKRETLSGNGIHLWHCESITIANNGIYNQRDGIYFEFVKHGLISNNTCIGNLRYGLHFMFSDSCTYKSNTFEKNGAGVAVMYTKNVTMTGNKFFNNWGSASYGLLLKDISNSYIANNIFEKNTIGIQNDGGSNTAIEHNNFISNGWAVRILSNCENVTFTKNNFISNTFDVATNSSNNFNFFNGNFWSSYTGYDLNHDGIGDVPYHPVRLFSVLITRQEPSLILLRSLFIDILDYTERVFPSLTPQTLIDSEPLMKRIL